MKTILGAFTLKHILPLEQKSLFNSLGDQAYTEEEILANNMILILSQYSTALHVSTEHNLKVGANNWIT